MIPTALATCEHPLWRGGREAPCSQSVGLQRWIDEAGREHAACYRHLSVRLHRYPPATGQGDPLTAAKAERDRRRR